MIPELGRFPGGGSGNPLQYSCLENPMDRGAWWATVRGVANSRTRMSTHTISNPYAMYDVLSHGMAGNSILMFLILFLFHPIDMAFPIRGGAHSRGILCKPVRYPVLLNWASWTQQGKKAGFWVLEAAQEAEVFQKLVFCAFSPLGPLQET